MNFISSVPVIDEKFRKQEKISDISSEELKEMMQPIPKKTFHTLIRMFVFIIFLVPIRVLLCTSFYVICLVFVAIIRVILDSFGVSSQFGKNAFLTVIRAATRVLLFGFGIFYVSISGKLEEKDVRFIISNHVSILDSFVILSIRNITCFIKKCFKTLSIFDPVTKILDPVYGEATFDKSTRKEIIDRADSFNNYPVLFFPEGSPTNGKIISKFFKLPFSTPYKVQPMLIRYWMPLMPQSMNDFAWRQKNALVHIWNILSTPMIVVKVDILPPITMDNEGKSDINKFRDAAQLIMANYMQLKAISSKSVPCFSSNKSKCE